MFRYINNAFVVFSLILFTCGLLTGQTTQPTSQPLKEVNTMEKAPYHNIGDFPATHQSVVMVQRTIDGLGFRYHWATKGLTDKDLAYAPGNEGQTCNQVLEHIHSLSMTIRNTIEGKPNIRPNPELDLNFEELRKATLEHIKATSDYLVTNPDLDLSTREVVFVRGEKRSAYPFWHLINGPILDAVYHVGQVVSYRRTTGNPVHPKVNVFSGKGPE